MNLFPALLSTAIGGFVGRAFASRRAKHEKLLAELCGACDRLRVGIGFSSSALASLCGEISAHASRQLKKILSAFVASLGGGEAEVRALEQACAECGLSQAETSALRSLFSLLGRSDRAEQLELLATYRATLDGFRTEAHEESRRLGALDRKLGLLGGIAVGILLL